MISILILAIKTSNWNNWNWLKNVLFVRDILSIKFEQWNELKKQEIRKIRNKKQLSNTFSVSFFQEPKTVIKHILISCSKKRNRKQRTKMLPNGLLYFFFLFYFPLILPFFLLLTCFEIRIYHSNLNTFKDWSTIHVFPFLVSPFYSFHFNFISFDPLLVSHSNGGLQMTLGTSKQRLAWLLEWWSTVMII